MSTQSQKEIYDYVDRWKKEREFYKKAVMDLKTGTTWPYQSPTEERAYEKWKADVIDPATNEYYRGKVDKYEVSEDGKETKTVIEVEPSEVIRQITRIRLDDGREFLLTKGRITGYNEFGIARNYDYSNKEMYIETLFHYETEKDENLNRLRNVCKGPSGLQEHYLMPFTEKNAEKLNAKRDKKRCIFVVKDNVSQNVKQALDFEMFKSKSFDYIMNMEYLSEQEREEKRKEFEAMQNVQSTPKPTGGKK